MLAQQVELDVTLPDAQRVTLVIQVSGHGWGYQACPTCGPGRLGVRPSTDSQTFLKCYGNYAPWPREARTWDVPGLKRFILCLLETCFPGVPAVHAVALAWPPLFPCPLCPAVTGLTR